MAGGLQHRVAAVVALANIHRAMIISNAFGVASLRDRQLSNTIPVYVSAI